MNETLAGNAFACRWTVGEMRICWITQLVIHSEYRERGLTSTLLNCLRRDEDTVYGIMSSHPAAIVAVAKALGGEIVASAHSALTFD